MRPALFSTPTPLLLQLTSLRSLTLQGYLDMAPAVMAYALRKLSCLTLLDLQHSSSGMSYRCSTEIVPALPKLQVRKGGGGWVWVWVWGG